MTSKFLLLGRRLRRFAKFLRPALPLIFGAAALAWLPAARAVPYASGVTNNGGTVSFNLNESADNVTVIFDGGASMNDMGARAKGTHTFPMAGTTFQIVVRKNSPPGYRLGVTNYISDDNNILMRFVNQRGVAVNKNPASPLFGRIYVSVSAGGVNTASGRTLTDGIYVLKADQTDALGQGDTALTGGLNWANPSPNAESPHRVFVGSDDSLFISDWSDSNGSAYMTDGDVANGVNLLDGPVGSGFPVGAKLHGSINAIHAEGTLAASNLKLWVIDEDLQPDPNNAAPTERNSIWQWDINGGPLPVSGPPVKYMSPLIGTVSILGDIARGPDGKWYVSQRRAEPATSTGVFVRDSAGAANLWTSRQASRDYLNDQGANDLLGETCAVDVSPDGKYMAVLRRDTNLISILPLIDGIPDMTNRIIMPTLPAVGFGRDLGFDAAGNLYTVNSGQGLLRILTPGGNSIATTGSDGTFTVVYPPSTKPTVSVVVTDAVAAEAGPDTGAVSIYRTGDTANSLTVLYTLTGTATNGTDYETNVLSATIPAGETNVVVTITPIDDLESEFTESVVLNLAGGPDYDLLPPINAQVDLLDNDPMVLTIVGGRTNVYEGLPLPLTFTITRKGDTNLDAFIEHTFAGTAETGVDYPDVAPQILLPQGQLTLTIEVSLNDDQDYEGDETVVFGLTGTGFTVGTPGSVTGVIRDNEFPPACVLFADDFEFDSSAEWVTLFGASNGIPDSTVIWSYDYNAQLGIVSAPHTAGGTTRGVYLQVNKADAILSAAALNLYPAGRSFSGNYALRADMLLSYGAAGTTEHAQFGLNHSGTLTNRVSQTPVGIPSTAGGDGVWAAIETDGSNNRDYTAYTYPTPTSTPTIVASATAASLANTITAPPYAVAGSPGNSPTSGKAWADVELRQLNGVISLLVNQRLVFSYANTSGFTNGNVMLGMNDQFDSVGSTATFVIFDNVSVVGLDFIIKSFQLVDPNQVQIDFVSPLGGLTGEFRLQSGSDPASMVDDNGAVISRTTEGFRAVTMRTGSNRFYRIRR